MALLALAIAIWQCRGPEDTVPGSRPEPPRNSGPATSPPPVVPDAAPPADEASSPPPRVVRRSRIIAASGVAMPGLHLFVTGPAVVRAMQDVKETGGEIVAPDIGALRLSDGLLPPAYREGRTDGDGRFEIRKNQCSDVDLDLLVVLGSKAVGGYRIVHRIRLADIGETGTVRLPRSGAIEGVVRTSDGRPAVRARVYCLPLDLLVPPAEGVFSRHATPFSSLVQMKYARSAESGADGRFRIGGLRPAPYRLLAMCGDEGGVVRRVEVPSGGTTHGLVMVLDIAAAYVTGWIVTEGEQEPVEGCLVTTDDPGASASSQDDGTFRIGPVVPGTFQALVLKAGYEPVRIGPFELAPGRTFEAPTIYARPTED